MFHASTRSAADACPESPACAKYPTKGPFFCDRRQRPPQQKRNTCLLSELSLIPPILWATRPVIRPIHSFSRKVYGAYTTYVSNKILMVILGAPPNLLKALPISGLPDADRTSVMHRRYATSGKGNFTLQNVNTTKYTSGQRIAQVSSQWTDAIQISPDYRTIGSGGNCCAECF